jgi:hypothetical protein
MIPDEAIEAAAKAAHKAGSQYNDMEWEDLPAPLQKHYWFMAAASIQAAYPYIAAVVLNEAAESAIEQQFSEVTPRMLKNRARSYKPRHAD